MLGSELQSMLEQQQRYLLNHLASTRIRTAVINYEPSNAKGCGVSLTLELRAVCTHREERLETQQVVCFSSKMVLKSQT